MRRRARTAGSNPSQVGLGVRVAGVTTNFGQGSAQQTGRSLDLMINGDGFFVTQSVNETLYTRAGALTFDVNGTLITERGLQGPGLAGRRRDRRDQHHRRRSATSSCRSAR